MLMKKMLKITALLTIAAMLSSILLTAGVFAAENTDTLTLFVSASAEAGGDGSIDHPFNTVDQARNAIRELKKNNNYPAKGVTVYLREGQYRYTFELTAEDSGTSDGPIVYSAYNGEEVSFVGGAELQLSDLSVTADSRIPSEAQGKVYSINLKKNGIQDYGELDVTGHSQYYLYTYGWADSDSGTPLPTVTFNDEAMTLARYPNDGFILTGKIINEGYMENKNENPEAKMVGMEFNVTDPHISRWGTAKDPWIFGYFGRDWSDFSLPIEKIDVEKKSVKTKYASIFSVYEGRRIYVYNMLEELDVPGEWFYDKESGEFFIYPPSNLASSKILLGFSNDYLLKMTGVKNVTVRNMEFKGTRSNGIIIDDGCENVALKYCIVKDISGDAITMAGKNNEITGCQIFNIGMMGVMMSGGDDEKLLPGNNIVQDCVIYHYAQLIRQLKPAVRVHGVKNIVRNNLIYDSPCQGIIFQGFDLLIENNEIHSVQKEGGDAGAIYSQNIAKWGSVVRGNLIHDLYSGQGTTRLDIYGIYLDGFTSGTTMTENIIYNMHGGIFIHGGLNNAATDNIIINTERGIIATGVIDAVGANIAERSQDAALSNPLVHEKFQPIYTEWVESDSLDPRWNVVKDNICYNVQDPLVTGIGARKITEEWFYSNNEFEEPYATSKDIGFISALNNNYFLKPETDTAKLDPEFSFDVQPEDIGIALVPLRKALEKNAIVLTVGKPGAYVDWQRKMIDPDNYTLTPFIEGDYSYVPLRFFAEALNAEVDYVNGEAVISYNGSEMKIKPDAQQITVNGEIFELQAPARMKDDRIFVPLRACSELFGKKVLWHESGLIIISNDDLTNVFTERQLIAMADRI